MVCISLFPVRCAVSVYEASKRHGRLPWKCLVQPAINLARDGFEVTAALDDAFSTTEEDIRNDTGLRLLTLMYLAFEVALITDNK